MRCRGMPEQSKTPLGGGAPQAAALRWNVGLALLSGRSSQSEDPCAMPRNAGRSKTPPEAARRKGLRYSSLR